MLVVTALLVVGVVVLVRGGRLPRPVADLALHDAGACLCYQLRDLLPLGPGAAAGVGRRRSGRRRRRECNDVGAAELPGGRVYR
jgi:hypothetical protein